MINKEEAIVLLKNNNVTPSLLKHALASEAVLRALARRLGEDEEIWGMTGLLHDLDFPRTEHEPHRHGLAAAEQLEGILPEASLLAIQRHNGELNGTTPATALDYALRCGETVTGLIAAAALMRPAAYEGMSVKSIKKKMKDKAFAANVNRENIKQCAMAGMELDDFLALAIEAMSNMENISEVNNG